MKMTLTAYNRLRKQVAKTTGRKLPKLKRTKKTREERAGGATCGANLTEQMFNRQILGGKGKFIGNKREDSFYVTRLGSRYTPDFAYETKTREGDTATIMIEVKGKYRTRKDAELIVRRSRLAWEIAAEKCTNYFWAWAKLLRRGVWEVEIVVTRRCKEDAGEDFGIISATCRSNEDFLELFTRKRGTIKWVNG